MNRAVCWYLAETALYMVFGAVVYARYLESLTS